MSGPRLDRIRVVEHDPGWGAAFEAQRPVVAQALEEHLVHPVEHIGSTAVAGLAAKPIVDMLAVVDSHAAVGARISTVRGWVLAPEPGDEQRRRWSLCHPDVEHRTHHLHVVQDGLAPWRDWLAFRDALRADAGLRAEYAALKRGLAGADDLDRAAYRAGKAPFIERVLARTEGRRS